MIVQDVINYLEELAPLPYAEDFDNVGLLIGDRNSNLTQKGCFCKTAVRIPNAEWRRQKMPKKVKEE